LGTRVGGIRPWRATIRSQTRARTATSSTPRYGPGSAWAGRPPRRAGRSGGAARRYRARCSHRRQTRLSDDQTGFIRSAYAGAISAGREANAARPEAKAGKLVERFARDAADVLRFTTDTAIWFTNNQSERDLRQTKLREKISGTWRTLQGLADFAVLRSYLSTATKHGMDLLDVLQQLFTTGPWLPPDPAAVSG
jgi:transposase